MKILILEESPLARRFIKEELLPMGFELLEAATPQDALDILCTVPDIALITLRVVMKGMDGFQFLEHLNTPEVQVRLKEAGNHRTPAVIVTSNDTDQDRLRGFQVGAADFIQKPWPPGELLKHVNTVLGRSTEMAGMAVLVVDDSPTARSFIRICLQRLGVQIYEAEDGDQAVHFLREDPGRVDLVITDLNMVRMDGDELIVKVRGELGLKDLPVIFLSGNEDKEKVLTLFKLGATDYLKKPFLQEELVARMRAYLLRVQAQYRLHENLAKLRDMNVVKDQFLTACSHDLRSPLTGILGFAQLLEGDGSLKETSLEMVQGIRRSGAYLLEMIEDLLDIGKMASGHHDLRMKPQDLAEITRDSVRTLEHTALPKQVTVNLAVGTEDTRVMGDSAALMRICNNLVSNAIKFTHEGGRVTVSLRDGRDGEMVLAVTDTGIGIAADDIPMLFKRYSKASRSGTNGEAGNGLGLSIVKELVEAHHGTVAVESIPGEGTTMRVLFPRVQDGERALPARTSCDEPEIELVLPGAPKPAAAVESVPRGRILYAEADPELRKAGSRLLEKMGFEVVAAVDGLDALDKFQVSLEAGRFEAVLMDMVMPKLNGLDASRKLRKLEADLPADHPAHNQPVPVLAVTTRDIELSLGDCLGAGMNDFLTKPFVASQVSEALDRWALVPA